MFRQFQDRQIDLGLSYVLNNTILFPYALLVVPIATLIQRLTVKHKDVGALLLAHPVCGLSHRLVQG